MSQRTAVKWLGASYGVFAVLMGLTIFKKSAWAYLFFGLAALSGIAGETITRRAKAGKNEK